MKQHIAATPDAIGFLDPADLDESVKAITIDRVSFERQGYALQR